MRTTEIDFKHSFVLNMFLFFSNYYSLPTSSTCVNVPSALMFAMEPPLF